MTLIQDVIISQYGAALKMLAGCIERADHELWHATVARFPFWHVAYHVLFCTDLYLSVGEASFRPPAIHRENYNFLGQQPWPPFKKVVADQPYEKRELAEYLEACRAKASTAVAAETEQTLAGPSGFFWLPFTRLELHLYNIRHVQHHTGQLAAVIRRQGGDGVPWSGTEER